MQGPCLTGLYEKYLCFPFFVKENVSRPSDPCRKEWVFPLILSSENLKNSIDYNGFGMRSKGIRRARKKGIKEGGVGEKINEYKWLNEQIKDGADEALADGGKVDGVEK
jgi:hypothetical protein